MPHHLWVGLLNSFSHLSSHVNDFLPLSFLFFFFCNTTLHRPCLKIFMGVRRAIPCSVPNYNGPIHSKVLAQVRSSASCYKRNKFCTFCGAVAELQMIRVQPGLVWSTHKNTWRAVYIVCILVILDSTRNKTSRLGGKVAWCPEQVYIYLVYCAQLAVCMLNNLGLQLFLYECLLEQNRQDLVIFVAVEEIFVQKSVAQNAQRKKHFTVEKVLYLLQLLFSKNKSQHFKKPEN